MSAIGCALNVKATAAGVSTLRTVSLPTYLAAWLLVVAACTCCSSTVQAAESTESPTAVVAPAVDWQQQGWPLVQRFCVDCHNQDLAEAELDLSPFEDPKHAVEHAATWNRVLAMVRFGAMPPEDAELPTDDERKLLAQSIDQTLYQATCDLRPKAGRVTARRLNRVEYRNTIRDLLGIEFNASESFPTDDVGGGFDNNADVLSMPPMLLEKYIDAAEQIAAQAILDPTELKRIEQERSGDGIGIVGASRTESFYGRILQGDAFAWVEFDLADAGLYRVRVQGGAWNHKEGPQAYGVYDRSGKPVFGGKFDQIRGGDSHSATFSIELTSGKHFFIIGTLDGLPDRFDPKKPETLPLLDRPERLTEEQIKLGREQFGKPLEVDRDATPDDATLMVRRIHIEGPLEFAKSQYPPSHWAILKRMVYPRDGEYHGVEDAAFGCLKPLAERMFRGPVQDEVVKRYVRLVKQATDRGESYYRGMQIALTALLVSPNFLFRTEFPAEDAKPTEFGDFELNDYQLATRLSYFLWSSTPDDELLRLAKQGKLRDEATLKRQVARMIADPRSHSLTTEFAGQWFGFRNLPTVERDGERFPAFTPALAQSMVEESNRFFRHILVNNLPVSDLLNADYTFVNRQLAQFYGLEWEDSGNADEYRKVSLGMTPRRGLLTHASVLTLTSYPTRTSPVQRGKWILENILGTPAPEPPPNVPELEQTKIEQAVSVRKQLEQHRANPACASCHRVMDDLGFGFEQFNAIGQYLNDPQIDSSGELPGGRKFSGGTELATILKTTEASQFAATATGKLLGFAIGRELVPTDRCIVDKIVDAHQPTHYRLADLITGVVLSRPFRYIQPESSTAVVEGK